MIAQNDFRPINRVVCPKFGHTGPKLGNLPVKLKPKILYEKNNYAKFVNRLLVLKLFQLSNSDFIFL